MSTDIGMANTDQSGPLLRFAVLRHEGVAEPHFDLLFEIFPGSVLAAWRSACWPIDSPIPLTRLDDHRRIYLDYQGPISGNRGWVRRVAAGTCRLRQSPSQWLVEFVGSPALSDLILSQAEAASWQARPSPASISLRRA